MDLAEVKILLPPNSRPSAFTLVELLIVVATIAILAAIAVPNFLEAQVRAKVSRAKNDMRSLATAIESYRVDGNSYPPDLPFGEPGNLPAPFGSTSVPDPASLMRLTTPIAYLTSLSANPLTSPQYRNAFDAADMNTTPLIDVDDPGTSLIESEQLIYKSYPYYAMSDRGRVTWYGPQGGPYIAGNAFISGPADNASAWVLHSPGPEQVYFSLAAVLHKSSGDGLVKNKLPDCMSLIYDPTNGTTSFGAIWRAGGTSNGYFARQMHDAIVTQR